MPRGVSLSLFGLAVSGTNWLEGNVWYSLRGGADSDDDDGDGDGDKDGPGNDGDDDTDVGDDDSGDESDDESVGPDVSLFLDALSRVDLEATQQGLTLIADARIARVARRLGAPPETIATILGGTPPPGASPPGSPSAPAGPRRSTRARRAPDRLGAGGGSGASAPPPPPPRTRTPPRAPAPA